MVHLPDLCTHHQRALLIRAQIDEHGPWQLAIVILNIMLFTAATAHREVQERCPLLPDGKRDIEALTSIFDEIGCLACFDRKAFTRAAKIIAEKGLDYAAKVSKGEIRDDPDWPYLEGK